MWEGTEQVTDLYILLGAVVLVGIFFLWAKLVYEPKQRKQMLHMDRLFECSMAKILLKDSATDSQRMILSQIVERRPTIQRWPEWQEVWDGKPPVH